MRAQTMQHLSFRSVMRTKQQDPSDQLLFGLNSPLQMLLICCITCTLSKKIYIGEAGRRLGNRFREHLRDVERNDKDASKPAARHLNLLDHSSQHMTVCGLSLHQHNTESRKNLGQRKFRIVQIATLNSPSILTNAFHSNKFFSFFTLPCSYQYRSSLVLHINQAQPKRNFSTVANIPYQLN